MTKRPNRTLPTPLTKNEARTSTGYILVPTNAMGLPRMIRRPELRLIVPISDSSIYDMEQRGEFPRRFYITERCAVWDLAEVEAWLEQRRQESHAGRVKTPGPSIRPYTRRQAKVTLSNTRSFFASWSDANRCVSQPIVLLFPLPAECSIR